MSEGLTLTESIDIYVDELLELPGKIEDCKSDIIAPKEEIECLTQKIKGHELNYEAEAGLEVDDAGKKLYTNEKTRKKRARELMDSVPSVVADEQRLKDLRIQVVNDEMKLTGLRDRFSALKVTIKALTEQLHAETVEKAIKNPVKNIMEIKHATA